MPRVSIITPTYQHEAFIDFCIQSVLNQTFTDWEMIIVDDGSTDQTVERVRDFHDARIKLTVLEHRGIDHLADLYNNALFQATGEFIAILEGDDYWPEDKLENQLELFEEGVVLVSGRKDIVDARGEPVHMQEHLPLTGELRNEPKGEAAIALLDHRHLTFTFPVATMMRKSALDAIGGFQKLDYLPVIDLPTFVKLASQGSFRWLEKVCGYWRRHDNSVTKSRLPEILDGVYRFIGEWLQTDAQQYNFSEERLFEFKNRWSAFMVHRLVLQSYLFWKDGKRDEAKQISEIATRFQGPFKRKMKAKFANMLSGMSVSETTFEKFTGLVGATNFVPPFDHLVDEGTLKRVEPWPL